MEDVIVNISILIRHLGLSILAGTILWSQIATASSDAGTLTMGNTTLEVAVAGLSIFPDMMKV
jgi:hypothetical protein